MEGKEFSPNYVIPQQYYYPAPFPASKNISLLVVPMKPNSPVYKIEKIIKGILIFLLTSIGNETSLKEVFANDLPLSKLIFGEYSPQDIPSFRVYRRTLDVISELHGKSLHVLILKSEGHKFPRNPNAHILELYCSTYFFGPLVVAINGTEKPYSMESFTLKELELIKSDNLRVHRIYPPPFDASYPTMETDEYSQEDQSPDSPTKDTPKSKHSDSFFMYRYKTSYCPNIANKHDWTLCIYAHRFTDYRRPPDLFDYSPDECQRINLETGECPEGDNCKFSHSTAERLYHPLKYKTNPCDCFKKMMSICKRGQNCAFYHNITEKRQPEVPKKSPKKVAEKTPPTAPEELKIPTINSSGDPSTNLEEEPNFENIGKRHRWTVHTTQEKLLKLKEISPSKFAEAEGVIHVKSEYDLCRSNLSSLVNSFSSSKGLPYYTELAFENRESDEQAVTTEIAKIEEEENAGIEDKFGVLDQIGTPTNNAGLLGPK